MPAMASGQTHEAAAERKNDLLLGENCAENTRQATHVIRS
jgi:hypothetical protein